MANLAIVKIGNLILREKAEPVPASLVRDPAFQKFLEDMIETMRAMEGVGLAANQVGRSLAVFALECQSNRRYPGQKPIPLALYLNPRIVEHSKDEEEDWEGCLSIPGYRGRVPRAKEVTLEALTPKGEKVRQKVSGFQARIIQHEVDHLNGLFYVDRMPNLKAWIHLEEFPRAEGVAIHDQS